MLLTKQISVLLFASFITITAFSQKKEKDKVLDKKVYTIELTETGKKKPVEDEIKFGNNKFTSKAMAEKDFKPETYSVEVDSTSEEHVITFEVTQKSANDEELVWNGTIKEEEVEGTAVISKKGKIKKEYAFTGTLKQGKKK